MKTMTNKTFIEEAIRDFDENYSYREFIAHEVFKDFLRKHLTQAFIKGVESASEIYEGVLDEVVHTGEIEEWISHYVNQQKKQIIKGLEE